MTKRKKSKSPRFEDMPIVKVKKPGTPRREMNSLMESILEAAKQEIAYEIQKEADVIAARVVAETIGRVMIQSISDVASDQIVLKIYLKDTK